MTKAEFLKLIDQGGFIEHAQFGSNFYGTSVQAVKDVAKERRTCILDIEMEVCSRPCSLSSLPLPYPISLLPLSSSFSIITCGMRLSDNPRNQGVKQVKKTSLNARCLSIQPPSLEILEKRLRGRATDSEDAITQRLAQAKNELAYAKQEGVFDKVIINDDLEKAWAEFKAFCTADE